MEKFASLRNSGDSKHAAVEQSISMQSVSRHEKFLFPPYFVRFVAFVAFRRDRKGELDEVYTPGNSTRFRRNNKFSSLIRRRPRAHGRLKCESQPCYIFRTRAPRDNAAEFTTPCDFDRSCATRILHAFLREFYACLSRNSGMLLLSKRRG